MSSSIQATTEFFNRFDIVICLSLTSSKDRRIHILQLASKYNIKKLEFFDATSSESKQVSEYYKNGLVKRFPNCFRCGKRSCGSEKCNNTLIYPQVATFISYLRLWQYILDSGFESVLVIEDDIVLVKHANSLCEKILSDSFVFKKLRHNEPMLFRFGWALCKEHEVKLYRKKNILFRLGWALCKEHEVRSEVEYRSDVVRMSNPCHAINCSMAKLLVEKFKKINTTVDIYQHKDITNSLNSYTVFPPICYEMSWSTGKFESLIQPKKIRLNYLKKIGRQNSQEYQKALSKLQSHQQHTLYRRVLALGHPRCGSGYTSSLLKACGLDIGHELMGKDGISSWMFAVFDNNPFFLNAQAKSRRFSYFEYVIHHVREPLEAIASIMRDNKYSNESYVFRRKHILNKCSIDLSSYQTEVEQAVASFVYWNKIITNQNPDLVFRIEDEETKVIDFLLLKKLINSSVSIELPKRTVNKDKSYKGKKYSKPVITLDDLKVISEDLQIELYDYCREFGYILR